MACDDFFVFTDQPSRFREVIDTKKPFVPRQKALFYDVFPRANGAACEEERTNVTLFDVRTVCFESLVSRLDHKQRRDAFNNHGNAFDTEKRPRILVVDQHQDRKDDRRNGKADRYEEEPIAAAAKRVRLHKQKDRAVNERDGKYDVHGFRKLIGVYDELQSDRKTQQTGKQQQRVLIAVAEHKIKREQCAEDAEDQTADDADDRKRGGREEEHDRSESNEEHTFKVVA
jgi:hypothetical protein